MMKPRNKKASQGSKSSTPAKPGDRGWDSVAQASWESFPASDPPGWIGHYVDGSAVDAQYHRHVPAAGGEVTVQDDSFVVDVTLLAQMLELSTPDVQRLMREGHITSVCEKGIDDHQGQYRLTFVHGDRRAYVNVDAAGHILTRSVITRM